MFTLFQFLDTDFSTCGYANKISLKSIGEDDFDFVENFVRTELLKRLEEKCHRMNISFEGIDRKHFFGDFVSNTAAFHFNDFEKETIHNAGKIVHKLKEVDPKQTDDKEIIENAKQIKHWFCDDNSEGIEINAPTSHHLLNEMIAASKRNMNRPKQGFRYGDSFKRYCVQNRLLGGPMAYRTQQLNLKGCYPSISTTNRYIHRSDHAIIEGILRVDELLVYLKERNLPLWVSLSEDETKIENRSQFDSRSNQIIGFCLPIDENGMPIPFCFKARSLDEMLRHYAHDIPMANFVNTIIAKPLGNSSSFCLLIYGTNGSENAEVISTRWNFIAEKLRKVGIGVLNISTDSAPKNNAAMRKNSNLGKDSNDPNHLFKSDRNFAPPFYSQDTLHILTKLRNLFLETIDDNEKLPIGDYFIEQQHLQELVKHFDKDKHLLTATTLNPTDRMNVDSARKICSERVRKLLKDAVKRSDGTVMFLQIMSDVTSAFDDRELSPIERIEKIWYATFLVRIWRSYILNKPGHTIKRNFMSTFSYYCIELNAHALVFITLFLKKNNLTQLFHPQMFGSQPCESFFRQLRSFTSTNSTVVNFSSKEVLNRVSRIQLLDEITNDSEFVYPNSLNSCKFSKTNLQNFPTEDEIFRTIQKCKINAIAEAQKIGLLKGIKSEDVCVCRVPVYEPFCAKKKKNNSHSSGLDDSLHKFDELEMKLFSVSLKNYAHKFEEGSISEISSYVEHYIEGRRFVFKKTSICWFFGKESHKNSSDRRYRVKNSGSIKTMKKKKQKKITPINAYKMYKKNCPTRKKNMKKNHF